MATRFGFEEHTRAQTLIDLSLTDWKFESPFHNIVPELMLRESMHTPALTATSRPPPLRPTTLMTTTTTTAILAHHPSLQHRLQPHGGNRRTPQRAHPSNQGKRMSGDTMCPASQIYNQGDISTASQLTACNKELSWLGKSSSTTHRSPSNSTQNTETDGSQQTFKHKSINTWTYDDIGSFLFRSLARFTDDFTQINLKYIKGKTGRDLLHMTVDEFEKLTPGHGREVYLHFLELVSHEDKMVSASASPRYQLYNNNFESSCELPCSYYSTACLKSPHPHSDEIDDPNMLDSYTEHQQQQQHHQPYQLQDQSPYEVYKTGPPYGGSVIEGPFERQNVEDLFKRQDISLSFERPEIGAPYERHYQTIDTRVLSEARENLQRQLPSAALKTFPLLHGDDSSELQKPQADILESTEKKDLSLNEVPKKRGPGRPRKPENELKKKRKKTGRLWEFIRNLLLDPKTCPSLVRWENPEEGVFRFVKAEDVAKLWGMRKNNTEMNYEKLSRAMRYYYRGKVFEAVLGRRLVYKFGENAKLWRPQNPNFPDLQR